MVYPSKSLLKIWEKIERWPLAYPGTAEFFSVPPIISGMGKATKFKFGRYIHRVHANQRQFKNLGAIARENPSRGLTRRRVTKKRYTYIYINILYFTRFPRSPLWTDLREIWHRGSCPGRNHQYKFFVNRSRGFNSTGGRILAFPID